MIKRISTGSKNLDHILGGGLPSDSIALIGGPPGAGKSALAHQLLFSNLEEGDVAVYITTLGEPIGKVIRNVQSFEFFNPAIAARAIHYDDAGLLLAKEGLKKFLDYISYTLLRHSPVVCCIDGLERLRALGGSSHDYETFLYELTGLLSSYHCTSLWLGNYSPAELAHAREAGAADHVLALSASPQGERTVRVLKLARSQFVAGEHHYAITDQGWRVTPRFIPPHRVKKPAARQPLAWGSEPYDGLLAGGAWKGSAILVKGAAGSGKTSAGLNFLSSGVSRGEKTAAVSFKEDLSDLSELAKRFSWNMEASVEKGETAFIYQPPVDVNLDDLALRIVQAVRGNGAERLFINDVHHLLQANGGDPHRLLRYVHALFQYFRTGTATVLFSFGHDPHLPLFEELCDAILIPEREGETFRVRAGKGSKIAG